MILLIFGLLAAVNAGPAADKETYKDQYRGSGHGGRANGKHNDSLYSLNCTDPRTMRKHAAYTEWADAYSCTRHRCQPGGRNLAIYTVGCKRVEAPESAIECEEVVEDTNMQFPFCCTRLRCLVVVRGEVWTRVLGQPWEVLPAAPWSHMYKMKKPPPADSTFLPKTNEQGPVYELSENESDGSHDKVLRSGMKPVTDPDCNEIKPRAAPPPPDIVIALSTNNEVKEPSHKKFESSRRSQTKHENSRHKRARKTTPSTPAQYFEEDRERENKESEKPTEPEIPEVEDIPTTTDKPPEMSDEKIFTNTYAESPKPPSKHGSQHQVSWTEIPQNQWNDPHEGLEVENRVSEPQTYQAQETQPQEIPELKVPAINAVMSTKDEKPSNLQALVDAIGTRMRDIESVVQKMSEKVHQGKPGAEGSAEKRISAEQDGTQKHHKEPKRHNADGDNYKRFSMPSNRGSKYLHSASDSTAEPPLYIGDTNLTGYFSDASNSVLRRSPQPKEPPPTYMAPVETRRSKVPVHIAVVSDNLEDTEKKRKKHSHKKRRGKGSHSHKKHSHSKDDKRKHFNHLSSGETDKNIVSLEDSSALNKE